MLYWVVQAILRYCKDQCSRGGKTSESCDTVKIKNEDNPVKDVKPNMQASNTFNGIKMEST